MEYGIIFSGVASQRKAPDHRSEMTNQLLFGEIVSILSRKNEWTEVISFPDKYSGFILDEHILILKNVNPEELFKCQNAIISEATKVIIAGKNQTTMLLPPGARLYNYNHGEFTINDQIFHVEIKKVVEREQQTENNIIRYAESLINTPYLWGGKSPFGMDCSGFVQVVFRMAGIELPRDAWQQAQKGTPKDFTSESASGDLAFFGEENENITHVGIVAPNSNILHCSGKVRKDKLDHFGIFDGKRYTHKLRLLTTFKN